ncbi:MAG: hypothetical protein ACI88G_001984 [Woeseiaceae bacterium]|jgi:uncharacterized protein YcbX
MRIASLHIHPIKGMRAVDVTSAMVEKRGIQHDRRWLAVDANGKFLTQRSHPQMATMTVTLATTGLKLSAEGFGEIQIVQPSGARRRKIVIWDAEVDAAATDRSADTYMSEVFGEEAHLVFMDEKALRLKTSVWTPTPVPVSFADAFPILVTSTGSLAELNRDIEKHGGAAVPMARFRPNVVIDCDEAWAEDRWTKLQIGQVTLDLVKLSDRCIVTTTDQKTGQRMGKEPLASLARIHRSKDPRIKGVLFGVNTVPRALGQIRAGDLVEIID